MEKYIFAFKISNNQDEYAKCAAFIDDVFCSQMARREGYPPQIKYFKADADQRLCREWLRGEGFHVWAGEQICGAARDNAVFIFRVRCSNEDDVVNLLYFCLLKKKYSGSILCVDSEDQGKAAGTIPYFLYDQIEKQMPRRYDGTVEYISQRSAARLDYDKFTYFINTENAGILPMVLPKQKTVKKFSTLIEIDQDRKTARIWGESVGNCLTRLYKKCGWTWNRNSDTEYVLKNYWPNIVPKVLQKQEHKKTISAKQDKLAREHWEYRLFVVFTECLCTILDRRKIALTRSRYQLLHTKKFFDLIKDMPLLALYIFCLFDVASKNDDELEMTSEGVMEQLQEQIFNARDMVDGLLQIIENVYHSQYHMGFFYFRIHTLVNGNNDYLMQNYPDYLKSGVCDDKRDSQHFLEVKVADYSQQTIPYMFYHNYNKRASGADGDERRKYEELREGARKITLRSFFAPDENESCFWQKYNNIAENVVHHYGLQAFDSFVIGNRGYFYVQSNDGNCLNGQENFYDSMSSQKPEGRFTLPGSQYETLIPFRVELEPTNTLLNVNINYVDDLCTDYKVVESIPFTSEKCIAIFNGQPSNLNYQQKKEKTIHDLYEELLRQVGDSVNDDNTVIWCSAGNIALSMTEMFCKVMMLYIVNRGVDKQCYLMITDCTESHFVEITRMIALFYNKQGISPVMQNVQIYLSGVDNEEFLLAGNSIGAIATKAEKLAFARGIAPKCVRVLNSMLKHKSSDAAEDVDIIPFDMLPYGKRAETLFERNVRSILNTDIQSENFGCKLDDLHVRIGNKIHITTFYEAELLFHNNYYISRFAYWLAKEIGKSHLDFSRDVTLVGYETYSEMLLQQVKELLPKVCNIELSCIHCIIYEQKTLEKFRAAQALHEYADSQFLLIVPINTTTTTHKKLKGFLEKEVERSREQESSEKQALKIEVAGNYGIILIGSRTNAGKRLRKQYWRNTGRGTGKNTICSKILHDKITFFVSVKGIWHDPLRCERCFSPKRPEYICEQPLIETNKESIVPMHAIRIRRRYAKAGDAVYWSREDQKELARIKKLSEYLIYSHIVRKGNHFQYYFPTEKYIADPAVEADVISWLKECRTKYKDSLGAGSIVFDIIVSPLHFSNAAFTNAVNKYVFNDAALVLHFDVEKEFRSNVKTKYSNMLALYYNLHAYDVKAIINCHFIDDTVVSGASLMRARNLIETIFPAEDTKVKVNVFASIIVLINRMSNDSKRNYIKNVSAFYSYANLRISSMRNHEDACVLCKKEQECLKLAQHASLNEAYLYWKEKSKNYECLNLETYYVKYHKRVQTAKGDEEKQKKLQREREHAALRMVCSHKANTILSRIENYTEEVIEKTIYRELLMDGGKPAGIDEIIAYIKVIAKPFICFSKEVKNVIFSIMLKMLDYLLMDKAERQAADRQPGESYRMVKLCLAQVLEEDEKTCLMVQILINRLVELGSNFIIRKRNMERLLAYGAGRAEFYETYANRVKQLIFNSTDEIKCLYLEYLLLYDKEYPGEEEALPSFCLPAQFVENDRCLEKIFFENSRAIINGVQYLCLEKDAEKEGIEEALNENYYLENYARFLQFQKVLKKDKAGKYCFADGEFEQVRGMVRLKKQLDSILCLDEDDRREAKQNEPEDLYKELMKNIRAVTGAADGELIVPYQGAGSPYMTLGLKQAENGKTEKFDDYTLKSLVEKHHDTLAEYTVEIDWDTGGDESLSRGANVLVRYGDRKEEKGISEIYLVLRFCGIENVKLHIALKNLFVFRMDIWKVLNLNSNSLLQNWMSDRFYKEQMSKARALVHRDETELWKDLKKIEKKYWEIEGSGNEILDKAGEKYKIKYKSDCRQALEWALSSTVDSLIGTYNVKLLSGDFSDYMGELYGSYSLQEFWRATEPMVRVAAGLWGLRLVGEDGSPFDSTRLTGSMAKCRYGDKSPYPGHKGSRIIILAAIESIKAHSQDDNKDVMIYSRDGYLYIQNKLDPKEMDKTEKRLELSKSREGQGISVPVIIDICRVWYQEEQVVDIDKKNSRFVVRLPIVEREEQV